MLCKRLLVICLLLVSLLVSAVCPCLVSCSDSAADITMPRDDQHDDSLRDTADVPEYYVGNLSSKVFHRPDCNRVPLMNVSNYVALRYSRDEMIMRGYAPCGICRS